MIPLVPKYCAVALAALILAACQQPSGPAPGAPPATAPSAAATLPVISAPPAPAGTAGLPGDHASTARYRVAINLPHLRAAQQPLSDALRATADNAKRGFVQALPSPDEDPAIATQPLSLLLDFKVTGDTAAFTSVRETGEEDTGGAHPIPIEGTFVFDRKAGRIITLDDLFTQPDAARESLARFAYAALLKKLMAHAPRPSDGTPAAIREWKTNLLQMLADGTKPTRVNFSLFVVRQGADAHSPSAGLTLVFAPYQVAPYVYGTQTVEVPAKVFAAFLRPAYARDFTTQPEPSASAR